MLLYRHPLRTSFLVPLPVPVYRYHDEIIIGWIIKMLRYRVVIYYGSIKISVNVHKGCPQVGILPALLYGLVKGSLLSLLNGSGYFSQGFADDLAVLLIEQFLSILCELTQFALKLVEDWCSLQNQSANPDKTKLNLFTTQRAINEANLSRLSIFCATVCL